MAHYRCSIKTGGKGKAVDHADYIAREGRFADEERYGAMEAQGVGNMPEWARENPRAFWAAADAHERSNGNAYREFELALPRELERDHQIALVERFIESELGGKHAYQWALHVDQASDGGEQPHVHVMFSDRIQDGIERGAEQYFKRANTKSPEKGGCLKKSYGAGKAEAAQTYVEIRARWGEVQNLAFAARGIAARVDHRSLAEQGIHDREPGLHQGPAVAGIEARGEVSEVGQRQREQIAVREEHRLAVLQEARQVERSAEIAQRVAARERRELAPLAVVALPEDQVDLKRLVEADRRVQLGRTQVAAERRVERREAALGQAAPNQRPLLTRLVDQAQGLQRRLVLAFERAQDWVRERFAGKEPEAERDLSLRQQRLGKRPTLEETRAQARADWFKYRAESQAKVSGAKSLEETRQQSVERWKKYRQQPQEKREQAEERDQELKHERRDKGQDAPEFE